MMIKRKVQEAEPSELTAKIERYEQTYSISRHGIDGDATSDEALIEIQARIIGISPRYTQHLGQPIDITLACAATCEKVGCAPSQVWKSASSSMTTRPRIAKCATPHSCSHSASKRPVRVGVSQK